MLSRQLDGPGILPARSRPAYLQVADYLRDKLAHPDSGEQSKLPTEAELMVTFGVSRQTARRAYAELVARGLVNRAPGRGSFPSKSGRFLMSVGTVDDLLVQPEDREIHVLTPMAFKRDAAAASKLGLPTDDVAFVAYRLVHGGNTFGLSRIYLPPHVAATLSDIDFLHKQGAVTKQTVVSLLDHKLEHPIAMAKQLVAAIAAPADVAQTIECEANLPILKNEFLYFDADARPVELSVNFYNPEHYEFRIQLQRRPHGPSASWADTIRT